MIAMQLQSYTSSRTRRFTYMLPGKTHAAEPGKVNVHAQCKHMPCEIFSPQHR